MRRGSPPPGRRRKPRAKLRTHNDTETPHDDALRHDHPQRPMVRRHARRAPPARARHSRRARRGGIGHAARRGRRERDRRDRQMGDARLHRHPHALRRRDSRVAGAARIGAARRDERLPRLVLAVDRPRERARLHRSLQPRRSAAARADARRAVAREDLGHGGCVRAPSRIAAARPERRGVPRPFGPAHARARPRARGGRPRAAARGRAATDGAAARRRARRGLRRPVVDDDAVGQARRRALPVEVAAVDVRDVARVPAAEPRAAPPRARAAKRAEHDQSAERPALHGRELRLLRAQAAAHVAARRGRQQGGAARHHRRAARRRARRERAVSRRARLAASAGAVRGLCGRASIS